MPRKSSARWRAALGLLAVLTSCTTTYRATFVRQRDLPHPSAIDTGADFAKCHMRDGSLYVLEHWKLDTQTRTLSGDGEWHSVFRDHSRAGHFTVSFDDIALLETNRPETVVHTGLAVMGVVTVASLGLTVFCAANPKSCFGSCPTFYAPTSAGYTLQAEGFSASIARAFEDTDVDALYDARPGDGPLELWMTNEALETHFVRQVSLLALPRQPGERVYRAGNRFFPGRDANPPQSCGALAGDCLAELSELDGKEYFSQSDGTDLGAKEQVDLSFPARSGPVGLVLAARNTLLNTFVFYQGLAYLGEDAGEFFARLDRDPKVLPALRAIGNLLGNVEVELARPDGGYERWGEFAEVGPIAREVELVTLPSTRPPSDIRVRLTMTRANFRLDYAALVTLGEERTALEIRPTELVRERAADGQGLARLNHPEQYLVTYPGDAYVLSFDLPNAGNYELFLKTRGYYYEWMRDGWLGERSPLAALRLLTQPEAALRDLAPAYRTLEPKMDELFWNSRVPPRTRPPGPP